MDDLTVLSITLGTKPYLFGPAPCDADADVYAVLDINQVLHSHKTSPQMKALVQQFPNLCQHAKRIQDNYDPQHSTRWWKQ